MKKSWYLAWLGFAIVMALAISFRLYDITHYPAGLFPDQAANGEDALLILHGHLQPFYPRGNGREALFFYIQAAFIHFFGIGVWPMFAASAAVGTLGVVFTYVALLVWFGPLTAFFGGLCMATNHWAVTISRDGFRAGMIPLFVAAFTAFVGLAVQAVRRKQTALSYVYAVLAGAAFMGGFYTYIAYRVMVGVILGMCILLLMAALHAKVGFPQLKRYRVHLLAAAAIGVIVIIPLAWYFIHHPEAFVGRAGQVSVFNPSLQVPGGVVPTILDVTKKTILSFFIGHGDLNWRQNVAGFPLLNPLVALAFLTGLVLVLDRCVRVAYCLVRGHTIGRDFIYPYLLLVLGGMLAPVITTAEGIPHGLRSIGLLVPIMALAALGMTYIWRWVSRNAHSLVIRRSLYGVLAGLMVVFMLYDATLYFLIARNDPNAYYAFRGDLTIVSNYINEYRARHADLPRPYLVLDAYSLQTVHYLCSVAAHEDGSHPDAALHKYQDVDPAQSHTVDLAPNEIIIFTQSTIADADRYISVHPDVKLITNAHNRWGQEIMRVYGAPENSPGPDDSSLDS
jgi:hypothetical protein